ncbi:MAG: hypothetical protein ACE37M_03380 [Henriciella sp.]
MLKPLSALAVIMACPMLASAQVSNNGELSSISSTAGATYTLTVTEPATMVQITGLEDLDFEHNFGGDLAQTQTKDVCVYISNASETYQVQMKAPPLSDGTNTYPYSISFTDTSDDTRTVGATGITQAFDQTVGGFNASNSSMCRNGDTPARLTVSMDGTPTATTGGVDGFAKAMVELIVMPD